MFNYKEEERPAKSEEVNDNKEDRTDVFKEEQASISAFKPGQPGVKKGGRQIRRTEVRDKEEENDTDFEEEQVPVITTRSSDKYKLRLTS